MVINAKTVLVPFLVCALSSKTCRQQQRKYMIEMQIVFSPQKLTELLLSSLRLSLPILIGIIMIIIIITIIIIIIIIIIQVYYNFDQSFCFGQKKNTLKVLKDLFQPIQPCSPKSDSTATKILRLFEVGQWVQKKKFNAN